MNRFEITFVRLHLGGKVKVASSTTILGLVKPYDLTNVIQSLQVIVGNLHLVEHSITNTKLVHRFLLAINRTIADVNDRNKIQELLHSVMQQRRAFPCLVEIEQSHRCCHSSVKNTQPKKFSQLISASILTFDSVNFRKENMTM